MSPSNEGWWLPLKVRVRSIGVMSAVAVLNANRAIDVREYSLRIAVTHGIKQYIRETADRSSKYLDYTLSDYITKIYSLKLFRV